MCGCGDYVAVFERTRYYSSCDKPTNVGHISHQVGIVLISDLTEAGVVETSRITADS